MILVDTNIVNLIVRRLWMPPEPVAVSALSSCETLAGLALYPENETLKLCAGFIDSLPSSAVVPLDQPIARIVPALVVDAPARKRRFDVLIVATAIHHRAELVTADRGVAAITERYNQHGDRPPVLITFLSRNPD